MRVLIIDDDEDVVFSLQTILCAKGVEVVGTGTDGSEAVKLYEELQPDILLMDIQMKPMNGLDAAEQILAKDKTARVLFLTTFSDDEYIIKALRLGTKGYLLKQNFCLRKFTQDLSGSFQSVHSFHTDIHQKDIRKIFFIQGAGLFTIRAGGSHLDIRICLKNGF